MESGADGRRVQCWTITPPGEGSAARRSARSTAAVPGLRAAAPRAAAQPPADAVYGQSRGGTTYGEEFANAIHHAYPSNDYDDLMAFVDGAVERGLADPERLYVTGGSGGGGSA